MDSKDLLAREEEFKRLNKQLEKRTESLMKEIENVMQKQDIFSEFSSTLTNRTKKEPKHCCTPKSTSPEQTPIKIKQQRTKEKPKEQIELNKGKLICNCCPKETVNFDLDFFYAFVSVSVQDKTLPQSFLKDKASVESVCKFLASKVKLLQEQTDKLQSSLDRKVKQCDGHLTQIAEFESERLSLLNNCNNLKSISSDMKAKYMAIQNRFNEKDRQYKEQRSQTDNLTAEVKRLKSKNNTIEAKSVSQEQEIDRLKQVIESMKIAEKEFRTSSRSLSASHTTAISRLESKIRALTNVIDKQRSLSENLKEQNNILTSQIMMKGLENEYCEFLSKD